MPWSPLPLSFASGPQRAFSCRPRPDLEPQDAKHRRPARSMPRGYGKAARPWGQVARPHRPQLRQHVGHPVEMQRRVVSWTTSTGWSGPSTAGPVFMGETLRQGGGAAPAGCEENERFPLALSPAAPRRAEWHRLARLPRMFPRGRPSELKVRLSANTVPARPLRAAQSVVACALARPHSRYHSVLSAAPFFFLP